MLDDIPPRAAQALCDAVDLLNPALADADQFLDALIADVESPMMGALASLHSTLDEFMGGVDYQLSDAYDKWRKIEQKLIADVSKPLAGGREALVVAGFTPPFHWADMATAVDGDPIDLVSAAVPAIGVQMGYVPPDRTGPTPAGTMPPITDPAAAVAQIDPAGNPLLTASGGDWNQYTATYGQQPAPLGTVPPPYAPSVPGVSSRTVWPQIAAGTPADPTCCPAPVTVNVTVPPIVIPPAAAAQVQPGEPVPYPYGKPPDELVMDGYVRFDVRLQQWVYTTPPPAAAPIAQPINNPLPVPNPQRDPMPGPAQPVTISDLKFPIQSGGLINTNPLAFSWNSLDVCAKIANNLRNTKAFGEVPNAPPKATTSATESWIDSTFGPGVFEQIIKNGGIGAADKVKEWGDKIPGLAEKAWDFVEGGVNRYVIPFVIKTVAPDGLINYPHALFYGSKMANAANLEAKTSFPMVYLAQSETYTFQYANPQYLPNQVRTDNAFLSGQISEAIWECWTRANGNLPEPARRVMLADQTRPGVRDVIDLYRRGHQDQEGFLTRMRELGVLDDSYSREFLAVTKAMPGMSDLIRFMVRDAADDRVAEKYKYDSGFTDKYTGQMRKWGAALGIDDDFFKFAWRSHWDIPSYTQLVEMLARLRPDRLEVREWDRQFGGGVPGVTDAGAPPRPATVTRQEVAEALQINDMAPGWVDRLIEVSYAPINRTDATRAYMTGAYTDEQMYDALLNTRYSPRDARQVLETLKKDRERRLRNVTGSWSARKTLSAYKNKLINFSEAETLLEGLIPDKKLIRKALEEAELDMTVAERNQRLKSLKRAFMFGEFSESDILPMMTSWGIDRQQADRVRTMWIIERDGRYKMPTVAQISKWLKAAIISVEEARHRLKNMGYKPLDADRIVAAALQFDYDGVPPSNEELSEGIEAAIKNQKAARQKSTGGLIARMAQILREIERIRKEVNRRRDNAGEDPLEPITMP